MAETPQKLIIDLSQAALPDPEVLERMEGEALELVRAGDLEKARNVLASVAEIREAAAQPAETIVDLDAEELAQRARDLDETESAAAASLRAERDARLSASDWTQLPDVGLDEAAIAAWTRYRQELRDWPQTVTDPFDPPPWPTPPNGG